MTDRGGPRWRPRARHMVRCSDWREVSSMASDGVSVCSLIPCPLGINGERPNNESIKDMRQDLQDLIY